MITKYVFPLLCSLLPFLSAQATEPCALAQYEPCITQVSDHQLTLSNGTTWQSKDLVPEVFTSGDRVIVLFSECGCFSLAHVHTGNSVACSLTCYQEEGLPTISEKKEDSLYVSDGSRWLISPAYSQVASKWQSNDPVVIIGTSNSDEGMYQLINPAQGRESITAKKID